MPQVIVTEHQVHSGDCPGCHNLLTEAFPEGDERVDVDRVLARVHAAVVLSESSRLVKAYPHSLLESLAAGKPIVVSKGIAIADYAERTGCGRAVGRFRLGELVTTLESVMADYPRLQATAAGLDMGRFAKPRLLADYERIYLAAQIDRS